MDIAMEKKRIAVNVLAAKAEEVFRLMGCEPQSAQQATDVLIRAELRGIHTHGIVRLREYVNLYRAGRLNPRPDCKLVHQTPSTALIDGDQGLGMLVARKAMNLAIEKAQLAGTGWVAVRNSRHYGIAGYYAMMALEQDMIGISMTNANPLVAPTFSLQPMLGTNPVAVAMPALNEPPLVADFATASVARGKLDFMKRAGKEAPQGLVQDQAGNPTTDAGVLSAGGAILPLGMDREHSSHKGYCMGALVDLFSAVLPGANFGPTVVPTLNYISDQKGAKDKGIGHFFGAMRVDAFQTAEAFKQQMDEWIQAFRNGKAVDGQDRILIPGDPERELETIYQKEGIPIDLDLLEELDDLCESLKKEMTQDAKSEAMHRS